MKTKPIANFAAAFILLLAVAFALTTSVAGCSSTDVSEMKQIIQERQADLDRARADAEAEKKAAQERQDTKADAKADLTLKYLNDLQEKLNKASSLLAQTTNANGEIDAGAVASAAGAALPPPWNLIAILGLPLLTGAIQEWRVKRNKDAAVSIINGITAAQLNDPAFTTLLKKNEVHLKEEFTPAAKALVNKHRVKVKQT